jgi:predicted amidohydrolase
MKETLHLGLVQANLLWEDPHGNRAALADLLLAGAEGRAAQQRAPVDLWVLPEMFTSGFTMHPDHLDRAEGALTLSWIKELALRVRGAVMGSLAIWDEELGVYVNRCVVVGAYGAVLRTYDKKYTFTMAGESAVYASGSADGLFELGGWKILPRICYDLRFPEWARNTEERRYDALIYVANWPEGRIRHWDALLRARAIENQAYVVGVNRVGTDANHLVYPGHSACLDPMGDLLVDNPSGGVGVLYAELSKNTLHQVRTAFPFLADQ